jgi:putative tryptophan/tyrosine transport system substrate-binding protein
MYRRTFVGAVAGALLAAPLGVWAQQTGKVFRIGLLANISLAEPEGARLWGAFIQGLRDLGYVEGQNVTIELRSSEGKYDRLPALAAELVRLKVDVIVVPADQNALAAEHATRAIPIVMIGNPIGSGLVANLARPDGNITGLSVLAPEIVGKQLELLKELIPRVSSVTVLWNPTNPGHSHSLEEARIAARSLGIELQVSGVRGPDEFEGAFAAMTRARVGAVLVLLDGMFLLHQSRIVELAAKSRLPAMYSGRSDVTGGGLMAYAASLPDIFRRAATYVDKILKGAKPRDLPIEQPTKFEFVINLKTAQALGLTIPQSLLLRADELIQ